MKKIYSIVLMATALLVGTNAWAVDVANWTQLQEAIATPNAEITLTANIAMPKAGGTFDFNGAVIDCNASYRLQATAAKTYTFQNVTLKNYTKNYAPIYVTKANAVINLENTVAFNLGAKYGVYATQAVKINNEATVGRIYLKAGGTVNNSGAITGGVSAPASMIAIVNNAAGSSFVQTLSVPGDLTIDNEGDAVINSGTITGALTADNVTINRGTFNGVLDGSDVTIHGGTFAVEPTATGTIEPTFAVDCKFVAGVGSLEIADGYAWRSLDGMIVRENAGQVEVTRANGSTVTCSIEEAFANVANGDKITLLEDVTAFSSLWLGTAEKTGAYNSLTLDLNGHTLSSEINVKNTIWLSHGALYIVNSVPGQGGIVNNYTGGSSQVVLLHGSPDRSAVNPRTAAVADLFTYLLIDEGVTLSATGSEGNGFSVDIVKSGLDYQTDVYNCAASSYGVAYGVRLDVKGTIDATKYAGKVNGYVRHPNEMIQGYPCVTDVQIGDTANSTFIHVFPTAVMHTANTSQATAVYSSGYARWWIQGLCQGANGVYVKSGVVDLTDATIESTYTGDASITTGKSSGVEATGYGVVVESNVHYTGQQALVIGGDTKITTPAVEGSAVIDVVDATHESKVESIVINGGSFTGDNAIVVSAETASEQNTQINGVTIQGDITVGGSSAPEAIADIMGSDTHTTVIENPDGTTTVVVSAGAAPTAATEWVDVAALAEGSDAKWTGFTPGEIASGITVKLGELQIISGNATDGVQELTIKDGATLNVSRLILNDFARIIVEAGGKLIVEGDQGINAPVVDNILLKNANGKQAIFLFSPNVTSNRHPNATVEMTTKSWSESASAYQWERFAVPSYNALKSITCETAGVASAIALWTTAGWNIIGYVGMDPAVDPSQLNKPFAAYNLLANRPRTAAAPKYKLEGELVGNIDAVLNSNSKWSSFANSYTAEIDLFTMLSAFETAGGVEPFIYVAKPAGVGAAEGAYTWDPIEIEDAEDDNLKLNPMQAFILWNNQSGAVVNSINYNDMVFAQYFPSASHAPRRSFASNSNTAKIRVIVSNEEGLGDNVKIRENANITTFEKFMNDDVNIYAMAEEKASIVASEDINNTYIGFSTVKGGKFTISFANVMGREFDLVDLETGARVSVAEGFEYNFTADAGYANDYRFKIVERHFAPTGIENTEAVKNAKGIFTITGQYVGEMNVWNTLPAGVYVVNGEKRVK